MKKKKLLFNISNRLFFVTLTKLIGFITVPIISRTLGPENYGIYNYVLAIGAYSLLPSNWGFLAKGIRDIAKNPDQSEEIVNKMTSARLVLWLLGSIVTFFIYLIFFPFNDTIILILLAIISNIGLSISIDYFFYGKKNTFIPSLSHLLGQVFFLAFVFLFVKDESDILILLYINLGAYLIESIILFAVYLRKAKFHFIISIKDSFLLLKDNFLLGLGAKASFFQNTVPILLIPLFLTDYKLGIFSAAFKFFMLATILFQTINLVFSPWIVECRQSSKDKQRTLFKRLIFGYFIIGLFAMILMYLSGSYLINLIFGSKFSDSQELIKLFSFLLIPIWPIYSILSSYMNNYELDKGYMWGSVITSVAILISVPLGIIFFDLNGVVFALFFSTLSVCIYYFTKINHVLKTS